MKKYIKLSLFPLLLVYMSINLLHCYGNPLILATGNNNLESYLSLSTDSQINGGKITADVYIVSDFTGMISSFRANISFDGSVLEYKKFKAKDVLSSGKVKSKEYSDNVVLVYLEDDKPLEVTSGQAINIMSVEFTVRNDACIGYTPIEVIFDEMVDYYCNDINIVNSTSSGVNIIDLVPFDCSLLALEPNASILKPDFDPNITYYSLDVDSSVDRIIFEATPANDSAIVKINRQTLFKQGSTTDITITVTAPDRSNNLVYTVSVNRMVKEVIENFDSSTTSSEVSSSSKVSSTTTSSSKVSSSSKSSSKTSDSKTSSDTYINTNSSNKSTVSNIDDIPRHEIQLRKNNFNVFLAYLSIVALAIGATVILIRKRN